MLLETVRVFSITLDQEHGSLLGGSTSPSEIIREHHAHHPNNMTNMGVVLSEQLLNLRDLINGNPEMRTAFDEVRNLI
jgi:hypothetical protein